MNVAAKCRIEKEKHPERFCSNPRCLWRIQTAHGPNPCRNHPPPAPVVAVPATPRSFPESARCDACVASHPAHEVSECEECGKFVCGEHSHYTREDYEMERGKAALE